MNKLPVAVLLLLPALARAQRIVLPGMRLAPVAGLAAPAALPRLSAASEGGGPPIIFGSLLPHEMRDEELERAPEAGAPAPSLNAEHQVPVRIFTVGIGHGPDAAMSPDELQRIERLTTPSAPAESPELTAMRAEHKLILARLRDAGGRLDAALRDFHALTERIGLGGRK